MLSRFLLLFAFSSAAFLDCAEAAPPWERLEDPEEELLLEDRLLASLPEGMVLDVPVERVAGRDHRRPRILAWSPNGRRVAAVGIADGEQHLVLDGEVLAAYDFARAPAFSADSSVVAWAVGRQVKQKKQRWWVLLNGKAVHEEDWIGSLAVSDDGQEVAFWSQAGRRLTGVGDYENERQGFVLLERKGRSWKERSSPQTNAALALLPPIFAGDRAFTVGGVGEQRTVGNVLAGHSIFGLGRGEKKPGVLGDFTIRPCWFAVDGQGERWGATVKTLDGLMTGSGNGQFVVLDGERLERDVEEVHGPYFSRLDSRVAVRVKHNERYAVELVGQEVEPTYDFVYPPVFGPAGQLAFVAVEFADVDPTYGMDRPDLVVQRGERFLVRRGAGGEEDVGGMRWLEIRSPAFSPDGERLAYAARSEEGWQIVVDRLRGPVFDDVGEPRFSADSRTVVHGARDGSELWWKAWAPAGAPAAGPDEGD